MKKIWKVKNNFEIKQSLMCLNVKSYYIEILLKKNSFFDKYLKSNQPFLYISYDDNPYRKRKNYDLIGSEPGFWGEWCWHDCRDSSEEYFYYEHLKDVMYCGEINLRKFKLEKLNKIKNLMI